MGKKVKNTKEPSRKVKNINVEDINSYLYKERNLVIDFSFEGAMISCKKGEFNNFLKDNNEFIKKLRYLMSDIQKLSQKSLSELIPAGNYPHCHKTKYEQKAMEVIREIFNIIGKDDSHFEQVIGGEEIFQLGFQSEIRLFGTISANVFRVYFVDYYHDFEFDERRNTRNKKYCVFCPINSEL
ncbi:hypothetical protein J2Z42_001386 [Clostridium algifaecis]|uniref:Uncharacterized protein n=1 Tax=Clostridium algifaecis TaxID=1472040 RepID=A0ABS4KRQ7_9CLOT|nr:hypothetical protein [Clostridium algifaecis]MBP2032712.1 hypothetical protein [Clostridium algifaecis]